MFSDSDPTWTKDTCPGYIVDHLVDHVVDHLVDHLSFVQVLLLTTFLHFFGFPAISRFEKKEVLVVEATKETEGIPLPAITIAVVNQIKDDSCFDKNASIERCVERDTLDRSEMLRRVVIGSVLKKEMNLTHENVREDFTLNYGGRYYTLDLPIKIGPDDSKDQLFLELNRNLTYKIFIHDPRYFLFSINPVALPTATREFTANNKKSKPDSWFYSLVLTEATRISLPDRPCVDEPRYNFQECLRRSIANKVVSLIHTFDVSLNITSMR